MGKWEAVEALYRLRIREVGSEHDFTLWHVECFGEGWSMSESGEGFNDGLFV